MYTVECLLCEFTADAPTLGEVFRLEEEHKSDAGQRHLVNWKVDTGSTTSKPADADGAGEPREN